LNIHDLVSSTAGDVTAAAGIFTHLVSLGCVCRVQHATANLIIFDGFK
jgi:hypothetical protein